MANYHKATSIVVLILFFFGLFIPNTVTASSEAQEDKINTECYSLDVVFVVDQSDSMSGFAGAPPTDPENWRTLSIKSAIEQLADVSLEYCKDGFYRVGMVSFGSTQNTKINFGLTDDSPKTEAERDLAVATLREKVEEQRLGKTDPWLGFYLAIRNVFPEAPPPPVREKRKRAIIFVTDGNPELESWTSYPNHPYELKTFIQENLPTHVNPDAGVYIDLMIKWIEENIYFNPTLAEQEKCLRSVIEKAEIEGKTLAEIDPQLISECKAKYPVPEEEIEKSTYIYSLLLYNGQQYRSSVIQSLQKLSEAHGGQLIQFSRNNPQVPKTIRQILSNLTGIATNTVNCGSFAVEPYLKRASFNIHKVSKEATVTLSYQDYQGNIHSIMNGQIQSGSDQSFSIESYRVDGASEYYRFSNPYPGIWSLTSDYCEGLDAYFTPFQFDIENKRITSTNITNPIGGEVGQFQDPPYYDPENPYHLVYQISDSASGETILQADHPRFAIDFKVTVTDPNGNNKEYQLVWNKDEQAFVSQEPIQVPYVGTYKINGEGFAFVRFPKPIRPLESDSFEEIFSEKKLLFEIKGDEFNVVPVVPFKLEITSPTNNQILSPIHHDIRKGWPLKIVSVPVRARITDREGNPLPNNAFDMGAEVLKAQLSSGETVAETVLVPDPAVQGAFFGEFGNLDAEGNYQLMVSLVQQPKSGFRADNTQASVQFSRQDCLICRPSFYYILLVVFLAGIVLLIIYNILIRTNKVYGSLVFLDGSTVLAEFNLYSGKNWKDIGGRAFQNLEVLDIKRLRAWNVGKRKSRSTARRDVDAFGEMSYSSSSFHPAIRVRIWPRSRGPIEVNLEPNLPVPYSSESVALIEYRPPD